jgi:hypothetical protein
MHTATAAAIAARYSAAPGQMALAVRKAEQTQARVEAALEAGDAAAVSQHRRTLADDMARLVALSA